MIELKHLTKIYQTASGPLTAVKDVNLKVEKGEIFGIIGLSGAGKSTLVRCINLLERPTEGEILLDGIDLCKLPPKGLLNARRRISMIFQNFNLLSQRSVLKNVTYPLEISGIKKAEAIKKARQLLKVVGLSEKENDFPSRLSGGQKQRVAIARALATDPKVLLCDECTSALDPTTTRQVLELLKKINDELGVTIIVITHEMKVIEKICNRVAVLDKSKIVECGQVRDVFLHPQSDMAKQLVLPTDSPTTRNMSQNCLRLVFDGSSSFDPLLAEMILECRVLVNIMHADTKDINGKAVGQMLLQLPDDESAVARIKDFLDRKGMNYSEEVLG